METSPEAAAAAAATDPPARTFSQVVFIDIPYSYPPSSPITCRFTLNAAFQPNPRDWVGIFKVGWSSTKDYHTFVWVEAVHDAQLPEMRQAVFKEYYLPKDEIEYYQFCYIDSSGQVRGASTPFCFKNPSEQNTESIADDDLLVITTQEHVEQSQREKAELQKQLDLMRAENETLKSALLKDQNEISSSKDQNDQTEAEMAKLIKEMDQVKEHNEKLKNTLQLQMKENDRLKEEMVIEMTKRMEIQKQNSTEQEKLSSLSSRSNEEKYDRAVMKINQMKEEREELKGKLDAQSDEISKLKAKLREAERELTNALDRFQLQQVDLQSTTKEKDRISLELQKLQSVKGNMDEVRRENQELSRRLSQQDSLERAPKDDLTAQCQTLSMQLQDAQAKLLAEREETRAVTRQCEFTENELRDVKEQLTGLARTCEMEQRQTSKFEMQARELNKMLADKDISIQEKEHEIRLVKQERDELSREVQVLKGDVERLRSHYANLTSPVAEEMPYLQPDPIVAGSDIPAVHDQQDILGQQEHIYNTIDSLLVTPDEEPALVCRHCRESFPGITHPELEQHEQSHRVCPFCTMICDSMEQSIFEDHVYGHEL
ncbi:calcium-binding and coiled-coil domain-containing protein 2 [Gambusia affinis]|uniref:calcium-binding and coiled-coil domain-containing protein 2 n=1 Tax=Gambusia affinis TaxID=33528 RepID=UPI001CDB5B0B|nr:calcium-binding and coiled-coil domain-containing protein 2 [Gambusia affinis]